MDMRQKLLPVFFAETDKSLELLYEFVQRQDASSCRSQDLEAAFRTAHTLKGTALLVKAEAVHRIARRLEALLERHHDRDTCPSRVELEAMQLAIEWLFQLVAAMRDRQPEPTSLVAEALRALDLAEHFPGATPLVELLDSDEQQRTPKLNDPFVEDPAPMDESNQPLLDSEDPFAEDPGFGIEYDVHVPAVNGPLPDDPFAEDLDLLEQVPVSLEDATAPAVEAELPYDPFAEDPLPLDVPAPKVDSAPMAVPESLAEKPGPEQETFEEEPSEPVASTGQSAMADPVTSADPFAEDPPVEEPADPAILTTIDPELQQLDSARDVAEELLLPRQDAQPRRDYVCCCFALSGRSYYLPIQYMVEISETQPILPLPLAPDVVKGLINLRGQVMPVVDLSMTHEGAPEAGKVLRLVIAEHEKEKLAFLAEGVPALAEEPAGEVIDLPAFMKHYRIQGAEL